VWAFGSLRDLVPPYQSFSRGLVDVALHENEGPGILVDDASLSGRAPTGPVSAVPTVRPRTEKGLPVTCLKTRPRLEADLPGPGASSQSRRDRVSSPAFRATAFRPIGGNQEDCCGTWLCRPRAANRLGQGPFKAKLPEDPPGECCGARLASSTPATDGERFTSLLQSGVLAFDLEGQELWHTDVGDGLAMMGFGRGRQPIVYGELVIVNASAECSAVVALDGKTAAKFGKPRRLLDGLVEHAPARRSAEANKSSLRRCPANLGAEPRHGQAPCTPKPCATTRSVRVWWPTATWFTPWPKGRHAGRQRTAWPSSMSGHSGHGGKPGRVGTNSYTALVGQASA